MLFSGCTSVMKRRSFNVETEIRPKSVAVLPVNRGTSNDVESAELLTLSIAKSLPNVQVQSPNKTKELLKKKFGITVAGQLEAEDKNQLEKELGVDGLVFVDINKLRTAPFLAMSNFNLVGITIEKLLNIDVRIYNDGKLYKGNNIEETASITITWEQMQALKRLLNSPTTEQLTAFISNIDPNRDDAMTRAFLSIMPSESVANFLGDMSKKSGTSKGNIYETLIANTAKKIQF